MSQTPHADLINGASKAAWVVLSHLFGDQRSVIEPERVIWTPEVATQLIAALDFPLEHGGDPALGDLQGLLVGEDQETILLAAELLYLRGAMRFNTSVTKRLDLITLALAALPDSPSVPSVLRDAVEAQGTTGGNSIRERYGTRALRALAQVVLAMSQLAPEVREAIVQDPPRFGSLLEQLEVTPTAVLNILKCVAFPDYYEPLYIDSDRRAIVESFQFLLPDELVLDGNLDHQLLQIANVIQEESHDRIWWYEQPWVSVWSNRVPMKKPYVWVMGSPDFEVSLNISADYEAGELQLIAPWIDAISTDLGPQKLLVDVDRAVSSEESWHTEAHIYRELNAFINKVRVGDLIAVPDGNSFRLGRVLANVSETAVSGTISRQVAWNAENTDLDLLPPQVSAGKLLMNGLTTGFDQVRPLLDGADAMPRAVPALEPELGDDSEEECVLVLASERLATKLHTSRAWLNEVIGLLNSRKQAILYGPPGTGKTYLAREISRYLGDDDSVSIVQFHPSYSYEDFFEGFRPAVGGEGGMSFQLQDGPLKRIAKAAHASPSRPFFLIVDEINRANIAKVFGELYFLLEYRTEQISLQYSPDSNFELPQNLYIIGTMNTADRSIAMVDAAIRRRFAFIEMHPDSEPVDQLLTNWLTANGKPLARAELLNTLNKELGQDLRDFNIGPSYLMRPEAETEEGLKRIWKHDILPLLEEHFYGQYNQKQVANKFGLDTLRQVIARSKPTAEIPDADPDF